MFQNSLLRRLITHIYDTKLRAREILNVNKDFYLIVRKTFVINVL